MVGRFNLGGGGLTCGGDLALTDLVEGFEPTEEVVGGVGGLLPPAVREAGKV